MHQLGLKDLKGLLNFTMLLVFAFSCIILQTKALTLDNTLDFYKNLFRVKGTKSDALDKVMKNAFTKNKSEKDNDRALASRMDGDKCMRVSENTSLSRSSNSKSVLRLKLRFQGKKKKKRVLLSIPNMKRFLTLTIL